MYVVYFCIYYILKILYCQVEVIMPSVPGVLKYRETIIQIFILTLHTINNQNLLITSMDKDEI